MSLTIRNPTDRLYDELLSQLSTRGYNVRRLEQAGREFTVEGTRGGREIDESDRNDIERIAALALLRMIGGRPV